jgi:hypothetical protein
MNYIMPIFFLLNYAAYLSASFNDIAVSTLHKPLMNVVQNSVQSIGSSSSLTLAQQQAILSNTETQAKADLLAVKSNQIPASIKISKRINVADYCIEALLLVAQEKEKPSLLKLQKDQQSWQNKSHIFFCCYANETEKLRFSDDYACTTVRIIDKKLADVRRDIDQLKNSSESVLSNRPRSRNSSDLRFSRNSK